MPLERLGLGIVHENKGNYKDLYLSRKKELTQADMQSEKRKGRTRIVSLAY